MVGTSVAQPHPFLAKVDYTRHHFFRVYEMRAVILALGVFISWQTAIAKSTEQVLPVDSYGAIANDSSVQAALKNSQAISQASIKLLCTSTEQHNVVCLERVGEHSDILHCPPPHHFIRLIQLFGVNP